jgi:hypothetical protein
MDRQYSPKKLSSNRQNLPKKGGKNYPKSAFLPLFFIKKMIIVFKKEHFRELVTNKNFKIFDFK